MNVETQVVWTDAQTIPTKVFGKLSELILSFVPSMVFLSYLHFKEIQTKSNPQQVVLRRYIIKHMDGIHLH